MKKFLQTIGMLSLICFSFFYTEKVGTAVKEVDNLMVLIKEASALKKVPAMDAKIEGNTIIPGTYGKEVDIDKSYEKMKRVGNFQENLLEYKMVAPKVSIQNTFDKYVIKGNPSKNQVSFLFLVEEDTSIDTVYTILQEKQVIANFFIDGMWLESHNDLVSTLIGEGHNIGNLSYKRDYSSSYFIWMDTILKKIGKQKMNYCYMEEEKEEDLNICALNKNYTIKPSYVFTTHPMLHLKKVLAPGEIYVFSVNEYLEQELPSMIQYVSSKGLKIVPLSELLSEK